MTLHKHLVIITGILCIWSINRGVAQDYFATYQAARAAYEQGDYGTYLSKIQLTDSLRPNHPTILYNLAVAYALTKEPKKSLKPLEQALWMNAALPFEEDVDLKEAMTEFQTLVGLKQLLNETVKGAEKAIVLQDSSLHPEGIAYDQSRDAFYLGSVHHRKVIQVDAEGTVSDLIQDDRLWAIMGMTVDENSGLLWVCSTSIPEMIGYDDELRGKAKVLSVDIDAGRIVNEFTHTNEMWLGDLTIGRDGSVYATSSSPERPSIYRVNEATGVLEEWLNLPSMISLQGIASSGNDLLVADYREGLLKIDIDSKAVVKLTNQTPHPLKGIDGLYYQEDALVAIHNGLNPFRVVKYQLDESHSEVVSFEFLDKALPEYGEPTLGTVVDGQLFYIANSPWGAYDEDNQLLLEKAKAPIILKTPLN